ncbi:helix-turn-helix domain-containing protein [Neorhizobium sp. T786]|uniref:helix-turn-helix transcriptional regulator n=1 Tax=Pseudorhizobium xiangyangii TaxID=2883104 RepID=UPI001CFF7B69|nr:helix-turn-helix domain-containing protein [Neorhizobium xiangyangii]MCB5202468.1 helix-turn-helix domain-containing protein [Neorhizobium xiangyangii]
MGQEVLDANLTPSLCRAARGLLNWTQEQLAERSEVSRSTIRDYEGCRHQLHRSTATQIRRAFEEGGVVFTLVPGYGPGVCCKSDGDVTGDDAEEQMRASGASADD